MNRNITRRTMLGSMAVASAASRAARAQGPARPIRIGILTDLSGPYADSGEGSLLAAQMAAEDYRKIDPSLNVEIVAGDMQGKPDIGLTIARSWLDQDGVDAVADMPQSAMALAVIPLVAGRDKVALVNAAVTSEITGKACSPNTVHWTYDSAALASGTGKSLVKQGKDTWFFITADYAFGHALEADTAAIVQASGGKVLGSVAHPFPGNTDFSAYLLQAQASGAKVVGLANAGSDVINCVKQAHEFGLTRDGKQQLAALLLVLSGVHALGLETAQGLVLSEPFYWDRTDASRDWSLRFQPRNPRKAMPLSPAAGCYSCILHYLKTVTAMGPEKAKASGRATVAAMKAMPVDDALFGHNIIRADGRLLNPMYLFQVKTPAESRYPWDYLKVVATTPGNEAFRPMLAQCDFAKS
jgi:branched-chain amino acid transport system substrate-binding protein